MAARLSRSHSETVRQKIQASNLINRLQKHIDGEIELATERSNSISMALSCVEVNSISPQLKAIEMLLDRSVAKLQTIQHVGDETQPIRINLGWQQ